MPNETVRERWLRSMFSEPDGGKASFTRIASAFLVAFALGWVTHIVLHNHALPDFGGLSMFIGTLYGLNQAGAVTKEIMRQKDDCPPEKK